MILTKKQKKIASILKCRNMTTKNWLHYTLIIGALPLIVRCFILLFLKDVTWSMVINPIDFVFLGLTVNLTNIIELNRLKKSRGIGTEFKEVHVLWSIITIIFLAINLGVLYLNEFTHIPVLKDFTLKITSIVLCLFSLFFSYNLVRKLYSK